MAASGGSVTVDADLTLTVDGTECAVWSETDRLVVNAPTLSAARALLNGVRVLPAPVGKALAGIEPSGLTVEVRVRHAPVAQLGAGVRTSRLATLAGYEGRISLRGLAVAAYRRLL